MRHGRICKEIWIFLGGYIFLSGFVFIEPSPAEVFYMLFLPFLLKCIRMDSEKVFLAFLLFFPLFISSYIGSVTLNLLNIRFLVIDIYLFSLFILLSSNRIIFDENYFRKYVILPWTIAAFVNISAGFLCYITGRQTLFGANIIRFGVRLQGFFKDPNVLGPFLIPLVVYYLISFLNDRLGKDSIRSILVAGILSIGVLLTFSRAAWLNYAVSITITLLIEAIEKHRARIKVVMIIILIFLTIYVIFAVTSEIEVLGFNLGDFLMNRIGLQEYDKERFQAQKSVFSIMDETAVINAIFGIGPGNYEKFAKMATHSLFIRYLGERGIVGFAMFICFLAFVWRKSSQNQGFRPFLVSSLMGQLVNSLFIDSLHWRHLIVLIALPFLFSERKEGRS